MTKFFNLNGQQVKAEDLISKPVKTEEVELTPEGADIVEILESIINLAKTGKLTSLAVVLVMKEEHENDISGGIGFGMVGKYEPYKFLSGLARVTHLVNTELDESEVLPIMTPG